MNPFKIYKASAGSGKTFTLTIEYIKLAFNAPANEEERLDPYYFKRILAVTFTNDAARVMKERVMLFLKVLAEDMNDPRAEIMMEAINADRKVKLTKVGISEQAQKIREAILHNYSDFSISTIDSFSNRIIRSFTQDLKLPFNYEVITDQRLIIDEAVDRLQSKLDANISSELKALLMELALQKTEDNNSWYLDNDLKSFGTFALKENSQEALHILEKLSSKDYIQLYKSWRARADKMKKDVEELATKNISALIDAGVQEELLSRKAPITHLKKIAADARDILTTPATISDTVMKQFHQNEWGKKSNRKGDKIVMEQLSPLISEKFGEVLTLAEKYRSEFQMLSNIGKALYQLGTLTEIEMEINKLRHEKDFILVSDFNKKINEVAEREPVPFIYEKIGEKYAHILIDEFQDTSIMQWHNLLPLLSNSLAKGLLCLVVGDAKQAIYRWRGGNANMLVDLPALNTAKEDSLIKEHEPTLHMCDLESLQNNWRSYTEIIDFNNAFFANLMKLNQHLGFERANKFYADVKQLSPKESSGGYVSCFFIPKEGNKEDRRVIHHEKTLEYIHRCLDDGFKLQDITILTRGNTDASLLAAYLIDQNIEVISNESLLLKNNPTIGFIIHLIGLVADQSDGQKRFDIANYLYQRKGLGFGGAEIFDLEPFFQPECAPEDFINRLHEVLGIQEKSFKGYNTVNELTESIIRHYQLEKAEGEQAFIHRFLDYTLEYQGFDSENIIEFLDKWELKKEEISISTPASSKAVRIMTIHKAKGLEFPVVILPFADWEISASKKGNLIWAAPDTINLDEGGNGYASIPKDSPIRALPIGLYSPNKALEHSHLAESYREEFENTFLDNLNILYVAFTRPERRLYIISTEAKETKSKEPSFSNMSKVLMQCLPVEATDIMVGNDIAVRGEEVLIAASEEAESKASPYNLSTFTDYQGAFTVRRSSNRKTDSLLSLKKIFDAKNVGVFTHYAFEHILYDTDVEQAVENLALEGLIAAEQAALVKEEIQDIIQNPMLRPYFTQQANRQVFNEIDIVYKQKGFTRVVRPDRVVIDNNVATVIDYKTGADQASSFKKQLGQYMDALEELGYQRGKAFIVFTEAKKPVEVELG